MMTTDNAVAAVANDVSGLLGPFYLRKAKVEGVRPKLVFARTHGPDMEIALLDDGTLAVRAYRDETVGDAALLADEAIAMAGA